MKAKRCTKWQSLSHCGLAFAVLLVAASAMGQATGPLELVTQSNDIYGVRMVETGRYEEGIKRLNIILKTVKSGSRRTPVLINLCAAHTMLRQFEKAEAYCDEAVSMGWSKGPSLNNRGVMKMARGDYAEAAADFEQARKLRGAKAVSKRNFERAQQVLAHERAKRRELYLALSSADEEISPESSSD